MKLANNKEKEFNGVLEESFNSLDNAVLNGLELNEETVHEYCDLDYLTEAFIDFYEYFSESSKSYCGIQEMLEKYFISKYYLYKLLGSVRITQEVDIDVEEHKVFSNLMRAFEEAKSEKINELQRTSNTIKKKALINDIVNLNFACSHHIKLDSSDMSKNVASKYGDTKVSKLYANIFGGDNIVTTTFSNSIQNNRMKEDLYISISPLDILTLSENSYSWQSCLRLKGEYAAGSLSYILDGSTAVAFIGKYNNDFPCLDKKWRQLMYIQRDEHSDDLLNIAQSRQYPNEISDAQDISRRLLMSKINDFAGENLSYKKINPTDYLQENDEAPHYYDLRDEHYGVATTHESFKDIPHFLVGSKAYCVDCGYELGREDSHYGYTCGSCSY